MFTSDTAYGGSLGHEWWYLGGYCHRLRPSVAPKTDTLNTVNIDCLAPTKHWKSLMPSSPCQQHPLELGALQNRFRMTVKPANHG